MGQTARQGRKDKWGLKEGEEYRAHLVYQALQVCREEMERMVLLVPRVSLVRLVSEENRDLLGTQVPLVYLVSKAIGENKVNQEK